LVLVAAIAALAIAYLIQAVTPLRLDDDAVDYLRMAAALTDGRPLPQVPLPIGFSVFLSSLERVGLASSNVFVLANCVFIAAGLWAVWQMMRACPLHIRQWTVVLTLLAIPVEKSIPIALPEAAFFGCSLLALWSMSAGLNARAPGRIWFLAAAFVLAAVATSMRLIGVALLPPLIWASLHQPKQEEVTTDDWRSRLPRIAWLVAIGLLLAALIFMVATSKPFYVYSVWIREYYMPEGLVGRLARRVVLVVSGWGEIVLNLPFSRLRGLRALFVAVGAVSAGVVVWLMRRMPRLTPARIYILVYVCILVVWPNPSTRLWMPIIPLIVGEIAPAIDQLPKVPWVTVPLRAYVAWFILTGVAALAYSSRISLSGENFPLLYGRRGGMGSPEITEGDPRWGHIQLYRVEAARMLARYGDHRWR